MWYIIRSVMIII